MASSDTEVYVPEIVSVKGRRTAGVGSDLEMTSLRVDSGVGPSRITSTPQASVQVASDQQQEIAALKRQVESLSRIIMQITGEDTFMDRAIDSASETEEDEPLISLYPSQGGGARPKVKLATAAETGIPLGRNAAAGRLAEYEQVGRSVGARSRVQALVLDRLALSSDEEEEYAGADRDSQCRRGEHPRPTSKGSENSNNFSRGLGVPGAQANTSRCGFESHSKQKRTGSEMRGFDRFPHSVRVDAFVNQPEAPRRDTLGGQVHGLIPNATWPSRDGRAFPTPRGDVREDMVTGDDFRGGRPLTPVEVDRPLPRKQKKCPTYDGKGSFKDFLVQFEMIAHMNGWTEQEAAWELATGLRDGATGVLGLLDPSLRTSYPHLVRALEDRFEPKYQTTLHRSTLRNRGRKKHETVVELAESLKKLVRKAYPTASTEVWDQLTLSAFVDSLGDTDLEWAVLQSKPETVEQAVAAAVEFESFKEAKQRKKRSEQTDLYMIRRPRADQEAQECYYCGQWGHLQRSCAVRRRDERRRQPAGHKRRSNSPATADQGNDRRQ
jgi:hypothetical protein